MQIYGSKFMEAKLWKQSYGSKVMEANLLNH